MEIVIDPDVKAVAEFMQSRIEARKLVGVAESLRAIAPILWGHYDSDRVIGIELRCNPITYVPLPTASELHLAQPCVGGDFAEASANCR
jgi:hypothetical protein